MSHARRLIQIGDTAVFKMPAFTTESRLVSPYLDNRISCAVMLDAMSHIREYTNDLYFVFTVQEELGLRREPNPLPTALIQTMALQWT